MPTANTSGRSMTSGNPASRRHWMLVLLVAAMALLPQLRQAQAQYIACPPMIDLTTRKLPEIVSQGGRLRGTVLLADEQRAQVLPPAKPNAAGLCVPQLRRFYQNHENPPAPPGPGSAVNPPIPGPTFRAALGDVVELTFLNQINVLDYGGSIDRWENLASDAPAAPGAGCDSVTNGSGYPKLSSGVFDEMPNCFHGSSTGNLHFHGTHTSPMATADNVFLGIRPSPMQNGAPVVTGASVAADFGKFFGQCESLLKANNLQEWPRTWNDMGIPNWVQGQKAMLQTYDAGKPAAQQLWPVDAQQDAAGEFPQYYIGSFPYCFILPRFPGAVQPPGSLRMGQAPGTMWYHAHKHGSTALNVSNGMAGAFIIEDNTPNGYDGFIKSFYLQHPNNRKQSGQVQPASNWPVLQTTMVVNQLAGTPKLETNAGGQAPFSINGQQQPIVTMYPGEVQLWRIVNASTISGFYLPALPAGFAWRQTAQDGVQFDQFNYQSRAQRPVFVAAGNRIDLLVQAAPTLKVGSASAVLVSQGVSESGAQGTPPATPLMTIVMSGSGVTMPLLPAMPARPGFLKDIGTAELNTPPRSLNFQTLNQGNGSQHTIAIDGGTQVKFGEGPSLKIAKLGTVEEWKISNTTTGGIDHPFHIHINPFQVTAVFDPNAPLLDKAGHPVVSGGKVVPLYLLSGPPQAGQCVLNVSDPNTWKPCGAVPPYSRGTNIWWDVFPIPSGRQATNAAGQPVIIPGYFTMRTRFVDYAGSYVLHCHILAHEDRGMMLKVDLAVNESLPQMQHH